MKELQEKLQETVEKAPISDPAIKAELLDIDNEKIISSKYFL